MLNKAVDRHLKYLGSAQSLDRPKQSEEAIRAYIEEIEEALKFLGEGDGYYLIIDTRDGYGQFEVWNTSPNVAGHLAGTGSIQRQSSIDAFLEAIEEARKKNG